MIVSRHEEVACFLSLEWHYFAISGKLIGTGELILRIFINVQLLILLSRLDKVTFDEHFNLKCQIILIRITTDPKEVKSVLFVNSVFHVIELPSIILKELVSPVIRGQLNSFVQLVKQWATYYFYLTIGGALLSLLDLLELDILGDILLVQLHVDLGVWVDVDHPLLISVLITGLSKMLLQCALSR